MIRSKAEKRIDMCIELLEKLRFHVKNDESSQLFFSDGGYSREPIRRTRLIIAELLKDVEKS